MVDHEQGEVWLYPMLGAEKNTTSLNDGRETECKILYQKSGKRENRSCELLQAGRASWKRHNMELKG